MVVVSVKHVIDVVVAFTIFVVVVSVNPVVDVTVVFIIVVVVVVPLWSWS